MRECNLKIQINKCTFAELTTQYLGHIISEKGIQPDKNKVKAIEDMQLPTNVKEIRQFLGITGYYRKFIRDYAKVAYPMIKYLKKEANIKLNDEEYQSAFKKLKKLLISDPILTHILPRKFFFVENREKYSG